MIPTIATLATLSLGTVRRLLGVSRGAFYGFVAQVIGGAVLAVVMTLMLFS